MTFKNNEMIGKKEKINQIDIEKVKVNEKKTFLIRSRINLNLSLNRSLFKSSQRNILLRFGKTKK